MKLNFSQKSWFVLFFTSFLLSPNQANATTELALQLDVSWLQDSNPLRFAQDVNLNRVLPGGKLEDSVLANDLRFALIHPLDSPETRLVFTGQLGQRRFEQMTQLNHTESAYKASFEWRWSDQWKGALSHLKAQQLYAYENGSLTDREMTHWVTDKAELALQITPDIEVPLAISARQLAHDLPVNWVFDRDEKIVDAGVRFRTTSGSMLGLGVRSTEVTSPKRTAQQVSSLDSGYQDKEVYAESSWQYSALTRFDGRIASLHRSYVNLSAMNFSAMTTELKVRYDYSAKTRLTLDLWSRPYGVTDPAVLYAIGAGARLGARWQATAKTRLSLQASNEAQRYHSSYMALGPFNTELNQRRMGGSIDYAATRAIRFYVDGFREQLRRGALGADIAQNVFRLGFEYTYENMPGVAERNLFGGWR
ncbi:MAG: hypothetical protein FD135_1566 [Comamonadaceae bacterium]|nr:MAG: hypothetical protein FD135_1566 [Comamonadaceae bacterium]